MISSWQSEGNFGKSEQRGCSVRSANIRERRKGMDNIQSMLATTFPLKEIFQDE